MVLLVCFIFYIQLNTIVAQPKQPSQPPQPTQPSQGVPSGSPFDHVVIYSQNTNRLDEIQNFKCSDGHFRIDE